MCVLERLEKVGVLNKLLPQGQSLHHLPVIGVGSGQSGFYRQWCELRRDPWLHIPGRKVYPDPKLGLQHHRVCLVVVPWWVWHHGCHPADRVFMVNDHWSRSRRREYTGARSDTVLWDRLHKQPNHIITMVPAPGSRNKVPRSGGCISSSFGLKAGLASSVMQQRQTAYLDSRPRELSGWMKALICRNWLQIKDYNSEASTRIRAYSRPCLWKSNNISMFNS